MADIGFTGQKDSKNVTKKSEAVYKSVEKRYHLPELLSFLSCANVKMLSQRRCSGISYCRKPSAKVTQVKSEPKRKRTENGRATAETSTGKMMVIDFCSSDEE